MSPDDALERLVRGNERFVAGEPSEAPVGVDRRTEVAKGQHPFAVILGCADSRTPPEVLFGKGLGEIFTVRVAGNTLDTNGLGSIEYATAVLGAPLVFVLGHERCGAVAAALEVVEQNATFPGAIGPMIQPILPAAIAAKGQPGDVLDNAVKQNVRNVVERLRGHGDVLPGLIGSGRLKVVGGRYDLDDGRIEMVVT